MRKLNQSIPENYHQVFDGVLFDVYHWEQELYDGTTTTFEKIVRGDSSVIIPTSADGYFYVNYEQQPDKDPYVCLPAGRVESYESPLEGAKRELLEETGLSSPTWDEVTVFNPSTTIDWQVHIFNAKHCIESATPLLDAGEKIICKKVNRQEFIKVILEPTFRDLPVKIMFLEHYYYGTHEQWLDSLIN